MFSGMPSHSMQGQNGLVQGRQMMPPNFQQGMMPMGQQSFMPAANPMLFGARQPVKRVVNKRRGKWTLEEEVYANKLIEAFKTGAIEDCEDGCTLRSFLATKLQCAPMRISKKYAGTSVGKLIYAKSDMKGAERDAANASLSIQLRDLHEAFITSITSPAPVSSTGAQGPFPGSDPHQAAAADQQQRMMNMMAMQNMQGMPGMGIGMNGMKNMMAYDPAAMQQMMANMAHMQQHSAAAAAAAASAASVASAPVASASSVVTAQLDKAKMTSSAGSTTVSAAASSEDLKALDSTALTDQNKVVGETASDTKVDPLTIDEATFESEAFGDEDLASSGGDAPQIGGRSRSLKRTLNPFQSIPQKKRRFKAWSKAEELYCEALVDAFRRGVLKDCFRSCTLQAYLATKLHCTPNRIAVKFRTTKLNPARIIYAPVDENAVPKTTLAALMKRLMQYQAVFQTNLAAREHELEYVEYSSDDEEDLELYDPDEDDGEEVEARQQGGEGEQPAAKAPRVGGAATSGDDAMQSSSSSSSSTAASASAENPCMWATSTPGIWVPFNYAMSMVQQESAGDVPAASPAEESAPVFTTKDYVKLMEIARSQIAWSVTNELGAFVDCNETFSKVTGISREEVATKTIFSLTLVRDLQKNMDVLNEMMSQDPMDMPAQFLLRGVSGDHKPLLIILQLMRDEMGGNAGISCCVLPQDSTFPVLQQLQAPQPQQQRVVSKSESTEEAEDELAAAAATAKTETPAV